MYYLSSTCAIRQERRQVERIMLHPGVNLTGYHLYLTRFIMIGKGTLTLHDSLLSVAKLPEQRIS